MAAESGEIFAVLRGAERVWAVAAVHGEADRLASLHEELWRRFRPRDRLVYLGNYLGRGRDVSGTLDALLLFRRAVLALPGMEPEDVVFLRGAQEEMWQKLLQIQFAAEADTVFAWMLEHGVEATLRGYGGSAEEGRRRFREGTMAVTRWTTGLRQAVKAHSGHEELLGALKRAAYTEDRRLLFVHAGIDPHRPLSEQRDTLWWGSGYFETLGASFEGFGLVVRGFDRDHRGTRIEDFSATVDSGCGFGGPLAAACFSAAGALVDQIEA